MIHTRLVACSILYTNSPCTFAVPFPFEPVSVIVVTIAVLANPFPVPAAVLPLPSICITVTNFKPDIHHSVTTGVVRYRSWDCAAARARSSNAVLTRWRRLCQVPKGRIHRLDHSCRCFDQHTPQFQHPPRLDYLTVSLTILTA